MKVGRGLEPCTTELAFGRTEIKEFPILGDRQIMFIDTPGLDDSGLQNLTKITACLEELYVGIKISVIDTLTNIADTEMGGNSVVSFTFTI